jgi:hypothetical protein
MLRSKVSLVSAIALVSTLAIFVAAGGAMAKPKTQATGSFDCSCSKTGTCSFSTSGPTMSCTKGANDTCTGSCTLSTKPGVGGAAATVKSGAANSKLKAAD